MRGVAHDHGADSALFRLGHREAHRRLYNHLANGENEQAQVIKNFYDEYFSVLDLTEDLADALPTPGRLLEHPERRHPGRRDARLAGQEAEGGVNHGQVTCS